MNEAFVDVHLYLKVMNALIEEYGDFQISDRLHNYIIEKLADICEKIKEVKDDENRRW